MTEHQTEILSVRHRLKLVICALQPNQANLLINLIVSQSSEAPTDVSRPPSCEKCELAMSDIVGNRLLTALLINIGNYWYGKQCTDFDHTVNWHFFSKLKLNLFSYFEDNVYSYLENIDYILYIAYIHIGHH